jgi:hypothetical protein
MTTETLTLTMFSPTECVVKKTEKYDADVMEVIRHDKDFPVKYLRFLKAYHDGRRSSSYKEVIYQYAKSQEVSKMGRLYVRDMEGLQGFPHDIRNPLLDRHNWDCDMENAHYYLIVKLAKDWGNLPTTAIQHYISNRDEELARLGVSRRNAKTLYLMAMYGGDVTLHNEFYKTANEDPKDISHIAKVKAEVETIADLCWGKFPALRKYAKKTNSKFSLLSLLVQTEERKCLNEINDYMASVGRYVSVLIHDGCAVEKKDGETEFPAEHLRGAEALVFEKTGHTIHLVAKRFSHNYIIKKQDDLVDSAVNICDAWGAEQFAKLMGENIVKDEGEVWIFNKDNGTWSSRLADLKTAITKQGNKLIFKQMGAMGVKVFNFSGSVSKTNALIEKLPSVLPEQNGYFRSRITSDIGKLLFPDGIYDFKTGVFSKQFDREVVFRYVMPYSFPERDEVEIAKIKEMVFGVGDENQPFNTQSESDTLRHSLMRGSIGDHLWKKAVLGNGFTNSGKGCAYVITKTTFGEWVETFEGNSLLAKHYQGEPERENTFMMAFIDRRFAFSSEIKLDKNAKIDSNKFKSITSGGTDPIKMRLLNANAVSRINRATMFMFAQAFPDFEPPDDAMKERVRSVSWGKSFVDNPTKPHERKRDTKHMDYLTRIESGKAFLWVMIDTYDEWRSGGYAELELSANEKEATANLVPQFNFQEVFEEEFEITGKTGLGGDFVPYDDIKAHMEKSGFSGGRGGLLRELDALGLKSFEKKHNRKATTMRSGVRVRQKEAVE